MHSSGCGERLALSSRRPRLLLELNQSMGTLWPVQRQRLVAQAHQGPNRPNGVSSRRRSGTASRGPILPSSPLAEVEGFQKKLTANIRHASSLGVLRDIVVQYQGCLNPIHTNALMVRTAGLVNKGHLHVRDMLQLPVLLPALRDLVLAQLPHYGERCVVNTLHSAAALDMRDRELLTKLMEAAAAHIGEMKPQAMANVAWALAKLRLTPTPRLQATLLAYSEKHMRHFKPQELADLGWAVATLHIAAPKAWNDAWLAASQHCMQRSTELGMVRLFWVTARMGLAPSSEWRDTAWWVITRRLGHCSAHTTASLMWAACRLWEPVGGLPEQQLGELLWRMRATLHTANATDLSVTLSALGSKGIPLDDSMAATLLERVAELLPSMNVRQVAQMLWAFARLRLVPWGGLVRRATEKLFLGLADARAVDVAQGLWGLSRLGWVPPASYAGGLFAQVQSLACEFQPHEVVALLSALAEMRMPPPASVLSALLGEQRSAEQQLSAYSPRNLAMLTHALARLHQVHSAQWVSRQQRGKPQAASMGAQEPVPDQQQQQQGEVQAEQQQQPQVLLQPVPQQRPRPPPLAGAPRDLREELLHCSFHRLGAMNGRDLSTLVWALVELQLDPPPAWLYSCMAACSAQLPLMSAPDVAMLVRALQRHNSGVQLARIDEFVELALARLGQLERENAEYTNGRLQVLLSMRAGEGGAISGGFVKGRHTLAARQPASQQQQQQQTSVDASLQQAAAVMASGSSKQGKRSGGNESSGRRDSSARGNGTAGTRHSNARGRGKQRRRGKQAGVDDGNVSIAVASEISLTLDDTGGPSDPQQEAGANSAANGHSSSNGHSGLNGSSLAASSRAMEGSSQGSSQAGITSSDGASDRLVGTGF